MQTQTKPFGKSLMQVQSLPKHILEAGLAAKFPMYCVNPTRVAYWAVEDIRTLIDKQPMRELECVVTTHIPYAEDVIAAPQEIVDCVTDAIPVLISMGQIK